jgi:hypothetical protein
MPSRDGRYVRTRFRRALLGEEAGIAG